MCELSLSAALRVRLSNGGSSQSLESGESGIYSGGERNPLEVFNIFVENLVEKRHSISVSDSPGVGSALCTGAGAGTLVVLAIVPSFVCQSFT